MPRDRAPKSKSAPIAVGAESAPDTYAAPLTPDMPVTHTHTVGGLSVEVPPIVREESAEKWGYVAPAEGVSLAGAPDGSVTPGQITATTGGSAEENYAAVRAWAERAEDTIGRYREHLDDIRCDILDAGWPLGDDSDPELTPRRLVRELLATLQGATDALPTNRAVPTSCEEYATRILAEDPRTALALYRRVSRGYGLAEWRPLGAGAQLVDLGTGHMLALVAPEGRRFVASYVESGTNLAGPTADTMKECKDAVGNRMRARGVGVL